VGEGTDPDDGKGKWYRRYNNGILQYQFILNSKKVKPNKNFTLLDSKRTIFGKNGNSDITLYDDGTFDVVKSDGTKVHGTREWNMKLKNGGSFYLQAKDFHLKAAGMGVTDFVLTSLIGVKAEQLVFNSIKGASITNSIKYSDELVSAAQKIYPKKAGKIEKHHPFPKYMGGAEKQDLISLDGAYHQQITNEFYKYWPKKVQGQQKIYPTLKQSEEIMKKVYEKFPLPRN
jgi:hypothetical protein